MTQISSVRVLPRSQCGTQISSIQGTIRVQGTYDFWRPKICLCTDHHTWWGGQTPEYELCFVRVLIIDACGQALKKFPHAVFASHNLLSSLFY